MTIFERKNLERDTYRKLRDEVSLNQRENVEKNVKIYSGHGPTTTLDVEKKMNPFILQIHQ